LISVAEFHDAYMAQLKSERISNPLSEMKKLLAGNKITDVRQIIDYALKNPGSRTEKLLNQLIESKIKQAQNPSSAPSI
jgi:hypothetical protein